ncbi:hypothetical protein AYJ01_09025 [Shewanella algae]|nr:hypothetical protein AYJ01_09025 [Shewanella algae]
MGRYVLQAKLNLARAFLQAWHVWLFILTESGNSYSQCYGILAPSPVAGGFPVRFTVWKYQ